MTNHIEELMKAAGVGKMPVKGYPLFTPEKQLELIKLLGKRKGYGYIGEQIDYFTEIDGLSFNESIAQITSNALSSKILSKAEVKKILED